MVVAMGSGRSRSEERGEGWYGNWKLGGKVEFGEEGEWGVGNYIVPRT